MISCPAMCGPSARNAKSYMRIGLDDGRNRAVRLVAQKLDIFGMLVRVGHPYPALLDPVLPGLRHRSGNADMIEDEHESPPSVRKTAAPRHRRPRD